MVKFFLVVVVVVVDFHGTNFLDGGGGVTPHSKIIVRDTVYFFTLFTLFHVLL